jgi:hypothetical protein
LGVFISPDIYLPDVANLHIARVAFCKNWLLIESELVGGLCPWIVLIACESN